MRTLVIACFATALLPLTACNFYFDGGDDDPPCADWGGGSTGGGAAEPALLLRNPETGVCEAFGWGGPSEPYPCDDQCGPCYGSGGSGGSMGTPTEPTDPTPSGDQESGLAEPAPLPSWGSCESYCTGLDEISCLGSAGCQAIYATGIDSTEFLQCWETGSLDVLINDCTGLGSETCSQSDTCIAIHEYSCGDGNSEAPDGFMEPECTPGAFQACGNEPTVDGCYGDDECAPGNHCNAAEVCLPPPGSGDCDSMGCDVPAVCYGVCVPDVAPVSCNLVESEESCIGREDCSPYYVGEDCVCDADPESCVCSTWTYDSCNGAPAP